MKLPTILLTAALATSTLADSTWCKEQFVCSPPVELQTYTKAYGADHTEVPALKRLYFGFYAPTPGTVRVTVYGRANDGTYDLLDIKTTPTPTVAFGHMVDVERCGHYVTVVGTIVVKGAGWVDSASVVLKLDN